MGTITTTQMKLPYHVIQPARNQYDRDDCHYTDQGSHHLRRDKSIRYVMSNSYGRGAEIWPECNESPVQLSESFPGGKIPKEALQILQQHNYTTSSPSKTTRSSTNTRGFHKVIDNIRTMDKLTVAATAVVILGGFVPLWDIIQAMGWSWYLWILCQLARAPRRRQWYPLPSGIQPEATEHDDDDTERSRIPNMPSLPPQGHVPFPVSNPLGHAWSQSTLYRQWFDAGVILGLWGPILLLSRYTLWWRVIPPHPKPLGAAAACARPLFWLGCQAITEAITRNRLMPLPIRILIPISYNTFRLGSLWTWMTSPIALTAPGRILAVLNWVYGVTNLLGFLLPVATVRYLRAHFFTVEAQQVHLRDTLDADLIL